MKKQNVVSRLFAAFGAVGFAVVLALPGNAWAASSTSPQVTGMSVAANSAVAAETKVDLRKAISSTRPMATTAEAVAATATIPAPIYHGEAMVLIHADDNQVLLSHNATKRLNPASTTKVVTLLTTILRKGTQLDTLATITPYAVSMEPSVLGVRVGDQVPLIDVAEGMMVSSGNDAAVVLAQNVSGSLPAFAQAMNETAKLAGATDSHFVNPHGLTAAGHYTTALDLAHIAAYGMRIPMFRDLVADEYFTMPYQNRAPETVHTTNHFIRSHYPGANGLKTGYTEAAGECLIASATRGGQTLIVVLLNNDFRWVDAPKLLDYGFQRLGITSLT